MFRRWSIRALLMAALLGVAVVAGGCTPKATDTGKEGTGTAEKEPIKIGAVLSLSGTYEGLGEPEKKVLDMEVERVNAAGGIRGRKIELLIVDDATDPAKARAATKKLLEKDKVVAVIGATGTAQTMAMRGDVDRAGIPQLSCAGGTVITADFDKLVFQTPWSNKIVIPFELKYLQGKGVKTLGVISESGGFGKDGLGVLKAELSSHGMKIVAEEVFSPGDTDMTTQLTTIKAAKPDALFVIDAGKEAAIVVKSAQQLGVAKRVMGTHGNARIDFLKDAGEAANGFEFAAGKVLLPDAYGKDTYAYKVATDFVARYRDRYDEAPDIFAGFAYDALYLIVEAAKRADGEVTPAKLRDEIEKTKGFVGIGGTFDMSPTDHNGLSEKGLVMYRVENGDWTLAR